jgi:polyisoprenoid-binding protein YceI
MVSVLSNAIEGYVAATWSIDRLNTTVGFTITHLGVTRVRGRFNDLTGTIRTGEPIENSSVSVRIAADSIDTGFPARDAYIKGADVLVAGEHPEITFESTGVRAAGGKYLVDGELTLRGITRPLTLTAELGGFADDPSAAGTVLGLSAVTGIRRADFGLSPGIVPAVLAANVRIELDVQAVLDADG